MHKFEEFVNEQKINEAKTLTGLERPALTASKEEHESYINS
jgi:hypothetical protein